MVSCRGAHNSLKRNGTATFKHDCVLSRDFALDATGALQTVERGDTSGRHVQQSRSARLTHRVTSGLSKLLPFRNRSPAGSNENSVSSDDNSEPSEILSHWLTDQAQADARFSVKGQSTSVGNSSIRSGFALHNPGTTSYVGSPSTKVGHISEASFGTARDWTRPLTAAQARGSCTLNSSPMPSDVFLTPMGGSLRFQSSDCLLLTKERSVTCPSLTRGGRSTSRSIILSRSLSWPKFELTNINLTTSTDDA